MIYRIKTFLNLILLILAAGSRGAALSETAAVALKETLLIAATAPIAKGPSPPEAHALSAVAARRLNERCLL